MISVIIPLYNKENDIVQTVQSVISQTFSSFELLIVDDGSTDSSLKLLTNIDDSRIKIIRKENSGVSATRDLGIHEAKFKYIALLDADDIWYPTFLEEMVSLIKDYPNVSLMGSAYYLQTEEQTRLLYDYGISPDFRGTIDYFEYAKVNTLYTSSSVVFKKQDYFILGGFDTSLRKGEDIDLWIKFGLHTLVAYLNKPLVIYKLDAQNRVSQIRIDKKSSLVYRLDRYAEFEKRNEKFKLFLDSWRLTHITQYLKNESTEVIEIKSLLNDTDLSNKSIFWTIMKYVPAFSQRIVYKWWFYVKDHIIG